jgi:hypothetical protein
MSGGWNVISAIRFPASLNLSIDTKPFNLIKQNLATQKESFCSEALAIASTNSVSASRQLVEA